MPAKYGWLHMGDSFEFSHALGKFPRFGEAKFFLAKPYLSSSRIRTIISREHFRISRRKNTRGIRPLYIISFQFSDHVVRQIDCVFIT